MVTSQGREQAGVRGAGPLRRIFSHPVVLAVALTGAVGAIRLMERYLPDHLAVLLIDIERETYPLTVQNVMWLVFALGLAELFVRFRDAASERRQLRQGLPA